MKGLTAYFLKYKVVVLSITVLIFIFGSSAGVQPVVRSSLKRRAASSMYR